MGSKGTCMGHTEVPVREKIRKEERAQWTIKVASDNAAICLHANGQCFWQEVNMSLG